MRAYSFARCFGATFSLTLALVARDLAAAETPPSSPPKSPPAQSPKAKAQRHPTTKKPEPKKEEPKKDEAKPFDEVVKEMQVIKGLFTIYCKGDDNKTLLEILPDQLDKLFLFSASVDQAVGERGLHAAQMSGDFPFFFRRVGTNVQWVIKNPTFTAATNTPAARATARSFPDSILGAAKIQSKPHPDRKSVLIDLADLLVADLPGLAPALSQIYGPSAYRFDKPNSTLAGVKAFPENVLFEVWLHFVTDNPRVSSMTLPDPRSVPISFKYDFSLLQETSFKPRPPDDRVGHFLTLRQDFTSDRPTSPYLRHINRWHLEKADPKAALSPPKVPIIFWLENTIPLEYREPIKQGVLLWNKAFEKIGFKDALVVKQQPDDADWDAADTRFNTIRWFAGVDAAYAIGPSRANPFTGQIYDADIGFSEGIVRSVRRQGEEFVGPIVPKGDENHLDPPRALPTPIWNRHSRLVCNYAEGLAQQAAFAVSLLDSRGALSPEMEEKLMREWLIEVAAHEVGHTLGLRHNFRASTILKPDELMDVKKTAELSQASSVMDYNPIVIAAKGQAQGHFVPPTLGPYDYWAIEYAYKPIDGDEKADLAKIASRVADPLLPYSTDEDAMGTFSPIGIDPLANQYDQSSDPIAYFRERIGLVKELWDTMEAKLAKPGEGYQVLRRALGRGLSEYNRGLIVASKFVGGVYHYRDHVGDPNARPPYVPVPAAKQKEALEFVRQHAFSETAFELPANTLNRLAVDRLYGLDGFAGILGTRRIDYPWHDTVLGTQRNVLNRLLHPITLARLQDNELRFAPGEPVFTLADLFAGLDSAIWSELDRNAPKISSLRRNLQREHLKQLIRLTLRQEQLIEDATPLARASLETLQAKIKKSLGAGAVADPTSQAHLQETDRRITAALEAQMQKPVE
jgi:hypothetical protein